ncbi:glycosyltransferase [Pedobacter sp. HMF7056]|uniref:Glycosyltransferase n=2 Tax=Hufsiella ginkgonis TaxID=2695274 RepID=A0A7K1Y3E2_9SPHI|nr:glycosyltransferase [Hufsiella ginkgonis]
MRRGGAEQVVLSMMKAYPQADLYTMCYQPDLTYVEFKQYKVHTSVFQKLVKTEKAMKMLFFPFGIISMNLLKIKGYDIVLISNTFGGKYVSVDSSSKVFIYTYTPFRLAWNPTSYTEYNNSSGIKRIAFDLVTSILRRIDAKAAKKGRYFMGMTKETAQRIKDAYHVDDVKIIHPPVKCDNFYQSDSPSDYYLIVSRLEFYKKVDLAIRAFNKLGHKLVIVGNGSKKEALKEMAKDNIIFKSGLPKEEIASLYANCKGFIFPQHEDYGITPLEANASGRPVIAYGQGGVLETMVPYTGNDQAATALFFKEQTEESLISAVQQFETLKFNPGFITAHAKKFDESVFVTELRKYIAENS